MSSVVVPDIGKVKLQKMISGESAAVPSTIKLFKSQTNVTRASILSSFTEADFTGYAADDIEDPITADCEADTGWKAITAWTEVMWTKNGATGNSIWGYLVLDGDGDLLWGEKFDASIPMSSNGAWVAITPKLSYESLFSNG